MLYLYTSPPFLRRLLMVLMRVMMIGFDYEMGSRGRRKERYPVWKERAHDSFWSQVDKPRALAPG